MASRSEIRETILTDYVSFAYWIIFILVLISILLPFGLSGGLSAVVIMSAWVIALVLPGGLLQIVFNVGNSASEGSEDSAAHEYGAVGALLSVTCGAIVLLVLAATFPAAVAPLGGFLGILAFPALLLAGAFIGGGFHYLTHLKCGNRSDEQQSQQRSIASTSHSQQQSQQRPTASTSHHHHHSSLFVVSQENKKGDVTTGNDVNNLSTISSIS